MRRRGNGIKYLFVFVLMHPSTQPAAQNNRLSLNDVSCWPVLHADAISNDGRYVSYSLFNPGTRITELTVGAVDHSFSYKVASGRSETSVFTKDSRRFLYKTTTDSLGVVDLLSRTARYFPNVDSYQFTEDNKHQWIALRIKGNLTHLTLADLVTGVRKELDGIESFLFANSSTLVIQVKDGSGGRQFRIKKISLPDFTDTIIYDGDRVSRFNCSPDGNALAFISGDRVNELPGLSLYYYKTGMDIARKIAFHLSPGMEMLQLSEQGKFFFDQQGGRLFFSLQYVPKKTSPLPGAAEVHVWSPHDRFLQPQQIQSLGKAKQFLVVIDVEDKEPAARQLESENDLRSFLSPQKNCFLAIVNAATEAESQNRENIRKRLYVTDLNTGNKQLVGADMTYSDLLSFSPTGKYVVWFDKLQGSWFCYQVQDNSVRNVSRQIHAKLTREDDHPSGYASTSPIQAWTQEDHALLILDRYDIWKVDPEGNRPSVNITRGTGNKHNIRFNLLQFSQEPPILASGGKQVVSAVDERTKDAGFYVIDINGQNRPEKLYMGPWAWNFHKADAPDFATRYYNNPPLKAKDVDVYVFQKMNALNYPNLAVTTDCKNFDALTQLAPQRNYNWYTTALFHFTLPDGKRQSGILYKPQDFDPAKKYPIIFYYYEKASEALHFYITHELSRGMLNIPWHVSNGYLVFMPDIDYKVGHPGKSALETVVAAAGALSAYPWVDPHHMGLQGHSFGGFETNYIATHSNLFAAAAPASGLTDLISSYGRLLGGETTRKYYERSQGRIGKALWEGLPLYLKNSTLPDAPKVRTPLLIMHTTNDKRLAFETQAIPWYTMLESLGKKVWMLQYDNEDHVLNKTQDQLDYTVRLSQFFDHYLKEKPAPIWMTRGIPATMKGIDAGYALDPDGWCAKDCKVCKKIHQKRDQ